MAAGRPRGKASGDAVLWLLLHSPRAPCGPNRQSLEAPKASKWPKSLYSYSCPFAEVPAEQPLTLLVFPCPAGAERLRPRSTTWEGDRGVPPGKETPVGKGALRCPGSPLSAP